MKLKDIIKVENIGKRIRYKNWPMGETDLIEAVELPYFILDKQQLGKMHYNLNTVIDIDGWYFVNSVIIKQKLGVK